MQKLCKQRESVYAASVEKLNHDVHQKLGIGTKRDAVVGFFAENGIPLTFEGDEATGMIHTTGCAPAGCGSDDAFLGLRVIRANCRGVLHQLFIGLHLTAAHPLSP